LQHARRPRMGANFGGDLNLAQLAWFASVWATSTAHACPDLRTLAAIDGKSD